DRPTLLVHSEDAAIPDGARRFHAGLAGPKDILWSQGTQFDFYDQEPQVTLAVDTVAAHFARTLS
ncbi:lysophospholipase, partial [Streptomyces sp. NPDC006197]